MSSSLWYVFTFVLCLGAWFDPKPVCFWFCLQDVSMHDFERVLKNAKPSVGPNDLLEHEKWTKQFGQDG